MTNFALSLRLGLLLKKLGLKLATAESCTGGGLAYEITAVPGSSEWFERGFITYSNEAKIELLGVRSQTLAQHGAVSTQTAHEMAEGVLRHSRADFAISITGIAGPSGGTNEKPVGLVWIGLARRNGPCNTHHTIFKSGRKHIRQCAIHFALRLLLTELGDTIQDSPFFPSHEVL